MRVYLDNNATTRPSRGVTQVVAETMERCWGNPSSIHDFGSEGRRILDKARYALGRFLGASAEEVFFTGSGTESNNQVLRGIAELHGGACHIVTSGIEHASVYSTCRHLEGMGVEVSLLPVDARGVVDVSALSGVLRARPPLTNLSPPSTRPWPRSGYTAAGGMEISEQPCITNLVSVMLANNDLGVIQPIRELAAIAREAGVLMHVDAVQAVGKVPVDFGALGVDLMTVSAHKFHGPRGVGLLLKRRGVKLPALLLGGKQERGQRAGTENVAGIAGMARAAEEASEKMVERALYVAKLRDTLEERLSVMVDGLRVNGSEATRLPNTSNLSFSGVSGQMLMILLDIEGVAVSTGSACASQSDEPSRVLMAAGRSQEEARESIRVSLSHENTEEEIDYAVGAICRAVEQIRAGGMGLRK